MQTAKRHPHLGAGIIQIWRERNKHHSRIPQGGRPCSPRGDTPGVVALIVGRNGVLYEGTPGNLDIALNVKMPPNAVFAIASMTKPVTLVGIMMLVEEEKLQLDDPVSKYLPEFDQPPVSSRSLMTRMQPMRLAQLSGR